MIKEIIMYTIICDGCGAAASEGSEYSAWNSKEVAQDFAMDSDWIREGGKHYCPDCFSYDDEDNLVLKNKKP